MSPELSRFGEVGRRAAHGRRWPYGLVAGAMIAGKVFAEVMGRRRATQQAIKQNAEAGYSESREAWRDLTPEDLADELLTPTDVPPPDATVAPPNEDTAQQPTG